MYQSEEARRGKGLRTPVAVQPIMVEALRWQKMDFRSPGALGTKQKYRGGWQEQEAQGTRPHPGEGPPGGAVP
jgi:hypothetical protein